ncbi:MAG: cytochrome c oxidase subunit II [Chloroflexota bacterium]
MRAIVRVAGPLLLMVLLGGCLVPPEPKTEASKEVFNLYLIIGVMALVVFVAVEGMIIWSAIRYRRRDDTLPHQLHGNNLVEMIWTAIPLVIVLSLFAMSISTLGKVEARADNPVRIEVEGFQWQWTFRYPDEGVAVTGSAAEAPTMVVPVGEPVLLTLTSVDVIHSFFVPHFIIKRDVVPVAEGERPNELEFTVTEPGTYTGQCAEFCGTFHHSMTFSVQAMQRADYDAYLADLASGGPSAAPSASAPADATVVEISAENVAFSTDQLQVPAGEPFILRFENKEALPHNVAIFDGDTALFEGDIVTGPTSVDYLVPALDAGEYDFMCQVHPNMTGTVVAE